jgi:hypothetical protein
MIALTAPNLLTLLDKVTRSCMLVIGHNQVDRSAKHLGEGTREGASYEVQPTRVFFPNFVHLVDWAIHRGMSQIWQEIGQENRNFLESKFKGYS